MRFPHLSLTTSNGGGAASESASVRALYAATRSRANRFIRMSGPSASCAMAGLEGISVPFNQAQIKTEVLFSPRY